MTSGISLEQAILKAEQKARASSVNGPRCALVQVALVYDWLYRAMVPDLRARFGTRFVYLTVGGFWKDRYGDVAGPQDAVVDLADVDNDIPSSQEPAEQVFEQARVFERKYGLLYMRDIIQQERSVATRFLSSAPNYAYRPGFQTNLLSLTRQINGYYRLFEDVLRRDEVELVFARPDSLAGATLTAVADHLGIPCTFPDVAKYRTLITWSFGAYRGEGLLRAKYDELSCDEREPAEDAESVQYADKDFKNPNQASRFSAIAMRLARMCVVRMEMLTKDVWDWKFGRRTSFRRDLLRVAHGYRAARWLKRKSARLAKDDGKLPFVLFLLPVEPEFNTHSLAREFNNSHAIAQQLALCLPAGYRLVLKEHNSNLGNRSIEYYRQLEKFPNIAFADSEVPGTVIARRAAAIATISGTVGMEASLLGKPVIVFSTRTVYGFLPHVQVVTSMYDLPAAVASATALRTDAEIASIKRAGARFYAAIRQTGFSASESPLFKGNRTILPPETVRQAFDLLMENYQMQRRLLAPNRAHM